MRPKNFKYFLLFPFLALLISSCEVDPTEPIDEEDPTISVTGIPQGNFGVGESFTVNVTANPNEVDPLKTFDIKEDNQLIDFERITIEGDPANANPILLLGANATGFAWSVEVEAHDSPGTREYSFNIEDDAGKQAFFAFDVTTSLDPPVLTVDLPDAFEAPLSSIISIPVEFSSGTYDLVSISVFENDRLITELDRLYYGDLSTNFDANPYILVGSDVNGASTNLYLALADEVGSNDYSIVLTDTDGNTARFDFTAITNTPVSVLEGVLFNAGGPVGTGGLDLDDGIGTGSLDPIAEIKDEGIDLDLALDVNWKQSISGVNGSVLRQLKPGENGLAEDFSFDVLSSVEQVQAVFENGEDFTLTNDDGELISASINVGDMFAVNNGDKYYVIVIREVNVVPTDNTDNYVIDIKK